MDFNFRELDTQKQHDQLVVKEGLWSRSSTVGGGKGGLEIVRGSVSIRDAIQREIEKERIREEILAEEIAYKRVLEAEVRREMAMEMAMHDGRGFTSSCMFGAPLIRNNRLEPGMPAGQLSAPVSFEEKYGRSRRHHPEIGGSEVVPIQWLPRSPGEGKQQKVIDLGAKGKAGEWRCCVCNISVTSEQGLNEHLVGKKHKAKMKSAAEIGLGTRTSTSMPLKRKKSVAVAVVETSKCEGGNVLFWCEMCKAGPCSGTLMKEHKRGKKHHMKKVDQQSGIKKDNEKAERIGPDSETAITRF